jgi:cytochrome c oxidase cbb3-type subunit 4
MDYGIIHSVATVAAIIAIAGVFWWAYTPANRQRFEDDALLPLQTDPLRTLDETRAEEKIK